MYLLVGECVLAPPEEYDWTIRARGGAILCRIALTACHYQPTKYAYHEMRPIATDVVM